jgi:hypothetical protein
MKDWWTKMTMKRRVKRMRTKVVEREVRVGAGAATVTVAAALVVLKAVRCAVFAP